jgi:hypothetical protein
MMTPPTQTSPAKVTRGGLLRWLAPCVLGAAQLAVWASFLASDGMARVMSWAMLLSAGPFLGVVFLLGAAIQAARRRRFTRPIIATVVLSLFALWPGAWSFGVLQIAYPASLETTQPDATVRLPADEPLRVIWGGDRLATNHHAFTPDQRWAYDLVVEPYLGGSHKLEDYGCWGRAVLAPIAAKVHLAHDGEPDVTPAMPPSNPDKPLGNHVVLELPTRTYLILAHLQRGSVKVKRGDRVTEGQPLGACGNSGNTSEPHIHIHHQRQDPAQYPVNFAEGLPLYFRDHDGPRMPEGGVEERDGKSIATGATVHHLKSSSAAR